MVEESLMTTSVHYIPHSNPALSMTGVFTDSQHVFELPPGHLSKNIGFPMKVSFVDRVQVIGLHRISLSITSGGSFKPWRTFKWASKFNLVMLIASLWLLAVS